MTKLFVWDFHGVLEKGNENAVVEVTNKVLEEYGEKTRLDLKLCLELYGQPWSLFFKRLCPEADEERIQSMVYKGVEISHETDVIERNNKPTDFSHKVLKTILESGNENLVISNTQQGALKKYLNAVKITPYINHIIGADKHRKMIEGNIKIPLLKEFLKTRKYNKIISIGDIEQDVELGKSVGATTYLFSRRGFLKKTNADHKISDLREVLKEV